MNRKLRRAIGKRQGLPIMRQNAGVGRDGTLIVQVETTPCEGEQRVLLFDGEHLEWTGRVREVARNRLVLKSDNWDHGFTQPYYPDIDAFIVAMLWQFYPAKFERSA